MAAGSSEDTKKQTGVVESISIHVVIRNRRHLISYSQPSIIFHQLYVAIYVYLRIGSPHAPLHHRPSSTLLVFESTPVDVSIYFYEKIYVLPWNVFHPTSTEVNLRPW